MAGRIDISFEAVAGIVGGIPMIPMSMVMVAPMVMSTPAITVAPIVVIASAPTVIAPTIVSPTMMMVLVPRSPIVAIAPTAIDTTSTPTPANTDGRAIPIPPTALRAIIVINDINSGACISLVIIIIIDIGITIVVESAIGIMESTNAGGIIIVIIVNVICIKYTVIDIGYIIICNYIVVAYRFILVNRIRYIIVLLWRSGDYVCSRVMMYISDLPCSTGTCQDKNAQQPQE